MSCGARLRVRYGETDAQGIVNNAAYLAYFEVGRVEWLRERGLSYRDFEERGVGLVVAEVRARYRRPARFDDELTVYTTLSGLGRASLSFEYCLCKGEVEIADGHTRHGCVELGSGRLCPMPGEFVASLKEYEGV